MISTVQTSNAAYVQGSAFKDDTVKSAGKTEKSEGIDKLSTLKAEIEEGTYKVDLKKTAKAIMEELL